MCWSIILVPYCTLAEAQSSWARKRSNGQAEKWIVAGLGLGKGKAKDDPEGMNFMGQKRTCGMN